MYPRTESTAGSETKDRSATCPTAEPVQVQECPVGAELMSQGGTQILFLDRAPSELQDIGRDRIFQPKGSGNLKHIEDS